MNATIDARYKVDNVVTEVISYDMPYGPRTKCFFLYPKDRESEERLPAVIVLHDHGGFKYFGKEKITAIPNEPPILREFKMECYGGKSWATELAKRGFAVLVPDAFLFGSRKIPVESLNEDFQRRFEGLEPDSREYIVEYNRLASELEHIIAKTIFAAGSTWPSETT